MRVFISSIPDELELYQAAACDVVDSLGMEPVVRDPTAGRGREQVAACARQVAAADLVLAIVGWRRGRVPAPELGGDGLHPWTFWEVRSAFEHRKPVRVMMAGETWRPESREEDPRGWAVMQDLRAELQRLAVEFEDEVGTAEAGDPEAFKERLRRQLTAARQGVSAPDLSDDATLDNAAPAVAPLSEPGGLIPRPGARLRLWSPPELPERPYSLLRPCTHPDLLAGRDLELVELRQLLLKQVPILGLHAASGAGKSSLLAGGLVPTLRAEGHPVAFDRHPNKPGLARRLLGDLVENEHFEDVDHRGFIEQLLEVFGLAGEVPILILDQFEELFRVSPAFRGEDRHAARAMVGALLATSVQRQPDLQGFPCYWLLAYRREFHGQVFSWLGDVLREARREGLPATAQLPHDLSGLERFHDWPLPLLGASHGRLHTDPQGNDEAATRWQTAARAFRAAIEKPLSVCTAEGDRHYPWRFVGDGAERLAGAFARARMARPGAPLAPELQVVLGYLLDQTGSADRDGVIVVKVPEDPAVLIDRAMEKHLWRALDVAFPDGGQAEDGTPARIGRTRALLALYELADVEGRRLAGLPAAELAQAIGAGGREVLERLATPETRLVVLERQDGGICYSLSHDRMAEVIVRAVALEGRSLDSVVDAELLAMRRFVALRSELFRSGEVDQSTAVPRRHFRLIAEHPEILLWGEGRRMWWVACRSRRHRERRRAVILGGIAAITAILVGLGAWSWVDRRERRSALFEQVAEGDPEAAFAALDQLAIEPAAEVEELLVVWRQRERPFDVFEVGLGGVDDMERGTALLRLAELADPLLAEAPEDPVRLASLVWALDFFAPRTHRAQKLRQRVMRPLRLRRAPPPKPAADDSGWAAIPEGTYWMGAGPGESRDQEDMANERPRHQVTISAFRMMIHEVTNAEYRRLVPEHDPEAAGDLPASRINWYEAYTYTAWLGGRLPTEAEWEYAARSDCAFTHCRRDGSKAELDQVAWWLGTSVNPETQEPAPKPVMRLEANPWRLFDVYGNVWEWTAEWAGPYSADQQRDPAGPTRGPFDVRGRRGGSMRDPAIWVVASGRGASEAVLRSRHIGLRAVMP